MASGGGFGEDGSMVRRVAAAVGLMALVAAGCAGTPLASGADTGSAVTGIASPVPRESGATDEAWCTDHGGILVDRVATWNTNEDPSARLELAGRWRLCEFETGAGDAATRISVDLTTLSSNEPTLASLAYLSKVPATQPSTPSSNPAAWYCAKDLVASSSFGNTAAVGGWVAASEPVFTVMNLCVFADGSAIDEFGLFYHSNGVIRGADLQPIFRYQPGDRLPAVFQRHGVGS